MSWSSSLPKSLRQARTGYRQAPRSKNPRPQSASSFQCGFCAGPEGMVHPETRPAFFSSKERDITNRELVPDQVVQPNTASDDVAPKNRWRPVPDPELSAETIVCLLLKKCNLAFIGLLIIEEPVPLDSLTSNAPNRGHLESWIARGLIPLMAKKVMTRRNVEMRYFKIRHGKTIGLLCRGGNGVWACGRMAKGPVGRKSRRALDEASERGLSAPDLSRSVGVALPRTCV
jgi:hypothetical protein